MSFLLLASGMRHIWKLHILMLVQRAYQNTVLCFSWLISVCLYLGISMKTAVNIRQRLFNHLKLLSLKELRVHFHQALRQNLYIPLSCSLASLTRPFSRIHASFLFNASHSQLLVTFAFCMEIPVRTDMLHLIMKTECLHELSKLLKVMSFLCRFGILTILNQQNRYC